MSATRSKQDRTPGAMAVSGWQLRFFSIWTGQALSLFGSELVSFALIWWLTRKTGSGLTLSTAAIVSYLPFIVLGPFAGTLVDRWNRRGIMIAADGTVAFFTAVMACLFWQERVQVWHIFTVLFLRTLGTCFHLPAMQASAVLMVPREHLVRIEGINEVLSGASYIVASPAAAWLLGICQVQDILLIDIATMMVAVVALLIFRIPQPEVERGKNESFTRSFADGVRYFTRQHGLLWMTGTDALRRLLTVAPFMMLPLLVTRHFTGGAEHLGWLNAAYGVGCILGGLVLSTWGGFKSRMSTALMGLFGYGLSMLAIGVAPAGGYWAALWGCVGIGVTLMVYNGAIMALLEAYVPADIQGRVFSLKKGVEKIVVPLGLLIGGPLADILYDVRPLFIAGGIACFVCGMTWVSLPGIRHIEYDLAEQT